MSFARDFDGWTADFAEYSAGQEATIRFSATIAGVPPEVVGQMGLRLSSENRSDDVAMYAWRPVEGLVPGARYKVETDLTIASNVPPGCVGVGGAPGEGVVVMAGAAPRQPVKAAAADGRVLVNVDKGNQLVGGTEATVLGNIATPEARNCTAGVYALKSLSSAGRGPIVAADGDGRLWLFFSTDSGFEGTTTLFVLGGRMMLTRVP